MALGQHDVVVASLDIIPLNAHNQKAKFKHQQPKDEIRSVIKMNDPIHVACCFDENMAASACVLAASIAKRSIGPRKTILHAFYVEETKIDFSVLAASLRSEFFEVVFKKVTNRVISRNVIANRPENYAPHITLAAFTRFMMGEMLPQCDRVIYLDSDTIILRSLEHLYDVDLQGKCLAAAIDPIIHDVRSSGTFESTATTESYLNEHAGKKLSSRSYFNIGVILIDLAIWRASKIKEQLQFPNSAFSDQDALNEVIGDDFIRLDERWNTFANYCAQDTIPFGEGSPEWVDILTKWHTDPWIVHFAGLCKPWKDHDRRTIFDTLFWTLLRDFSANQPYLARLLSERRKSIETRIRTDIGKASRLPRASIVIVNHNYGRFLRECVQSVMEQSYPSIECIIVDNASTDESASQLKELLYRYPDIKVIWSTQNEGQCVAMQKGFAQATGVYVAFLDADDYLLRDFIATHIYAHLSLPTAVGFTSSDMIQMVGDKLGHSGYFQVLGGLKKASSSMVVHPEQRVDTRAADALTNSFFNRYRADSPTMRLPSKKILEWVWAPTSGSVYRSDAVDLFINNPDLKKLKLTGDAYLNYAINSLIGSALLDRALAVYRVHGKNSFAHSLPLEGLVCFKGEDKSSYAAFLALKHIVRNYDEFVSRAYNSLSLNASLTTLYRKANGTNVFLAWLDRLYVRSTKLVWGSRSRALAEKFKDNETPGKPSHREIKVPVRLR